MLEPPSTYQLCDLDQAIEPLCSLMYSVNKYLLSIYSRHWGIIVAKAGRPEGTWRLKGCAEAGEQEGKGR